MAEKILPPGVTIVDSNEATGLVPGLTLKVANLDTAKRGDFVRLLVKFPNPAANVRPWIERLTCVVINRMAAGAGPLRIKVYSRPEMTHLHSIDFGDELTVGDRYILAHEPSTEKQISEVEPFLTGVIPETKPINAEDQKLRDAVKNYPPLQPETGREYWLRNGMRVRVFAYHAGVWIGSPVDGGATLEWAMNGTSMTNDREFDIVKDPKASEVVA
jgi:hypothetical protein